jgi:hypothetical protein
MELLPASALLQKPRLLKKAWLSLVCDKCVQAKHFTKHKEVCGLNYHGKNPHYCRQKKCQRMISTLWQANFLRSPNCNHGHNAASSMEASVSGPSERLRNPISQGRRRELAPMQLQGSVSKKLTYEPARTPTGKFKPRMTVQVSHPSESVETLDNQAGLPELVRKCS